MISAEVPFSLFKGTALIELQKVWLRKKIKSNMHNNHVDGGAPVLSRTVLVVLFTVWNLLSDGFDADNKARSAKTQ